MPAASLFRRASRHAGLLAGGAVVLAIVIAAALGPLVAPYGPFAQDAGHVLADPVWTGTGSWAHPFGTDALGRDELSRLIFGARTSLLIAVTASVMAAVIGTAIGMIGGYFGGRIDALAVYVINVKLALPIVLVALAVISITRSSVGVLIVILGLLTWDRYALVTRTLTQQLREREFVLAAHSVGASDAAIIVRELLPNVLDQIIVLITLEVAALILIEAALSYVGLGVPPPNPSWGSMIADGRSLMFFKPHLVMIPGIAIFVLVLAINLAGDGIRDVTSPIGRT
jgi:peptide/nickel transport system permease protein